jgi:hypothetical protein
MSVKFPSTKISNASRKVDKYLNEIYLLKDEVEDVNFEMLVEMIEDIESWRGCLDEIELSITSNHIYNQMNESYYEHNEDKKELIIY